MKKIIFDNRVNILFLFVSFFCLVGIVGLENVSFKSVQWLHDGDESAYNQLGWHFFQSDIWRFPLGNNPNYGDALGTSIVYSDSVPLLALFFKTLKSLLPGDFQYFSFWYFFCFYFQLFFSFKILKKFTNSDLYSVVGSLFFLFSPIFINRVDFHVGLSGQGILLFALYLGLTSKIEKSKFLWILVINLASLIHFYFTAMIFVVYSILRISNFYFEKESFFKPLKDFFIVTIFTLLTLYVVGYFEIKVVDSIGLGFGDYKLNLLSFFDPGPTSNNVFWSLLLPDIKLSPGEQLEGFNYLGLGQMLVLLFAFIAFFNKNYRESLLSIKSNKEIKIFVLISFLFTLWALSNKISIGSYTIIEIPLNKYIYGLLSIIRSSGRVFWIVNYFLLILSIIIIYTCFKKKHSLSIIALFLIIQIVDISPGLKKRIGQHTNENKSHFLQDPIWGKLFTKYKVIKTTHPESWSSLVKNFSYPMEKYNIKKTNLIILARSNRQANANARYNLYSDFRKKKLELDTVYVIKDQNHLRHLKNIYENENVGFFYRDNIWTMVKNQKVLMNDNDKEIFNKIKPKILDINQIKDI